MQITVEIPDELAAKAQASGMSPEAYVRKLIEEAERKATPINVATPKMDIETFIHGMATYSDKIPQLPDEAFMRESFYADHD
jgi:hypothetical protein